MPSSFTDSLRLEEQGVGENNNTWGGKLNSTIELIDKSIAGHVSVATTGGTTQLTTVNNGEDQARYKIIELTGTLSSNVTVEVPSVSKEYIVWDSTTRGGSTISFRIGAAGDEVLIPASTTRAFGISTDGDEWRPLSADLASETSPGIVEIATTSEAQAGSSNSVVLTPARLQDVSATETRKGVIEIATQAEVNNETDDSKAVVPETLAAYVTSRIGSDIVAASETEAGVVELATDAEAQTGTDTERAVTPAGLAATTATLTRAGVVELATEADTLAGTDAVRAVVPATLKAYGEQGAGGGLDADLLDGEQGSAYLKKSEFNPANEQLIWSGSSSSASLSTPVRSGLYIVQIDSALFLPVMVHSGRQGSYSAVSAVPSSDETTHWRLGYVGGSSPSFEVEKWEVSASAGTVTAVSASIENIWSYYGGS